MKYMGAIRSFVIQILDQLGVTTAGVYTSPTTAATYTATDAVILNAATTAGSRLEVNSGVLTVREGDDSDWGPAATGPFTIKTIGQTATAHEVTFTGAGNGFVNIARGDAGDVSMALTNGGLRAVTGIYGTDGGGNIAVRTVCGAVTVTDNTITTVATLTGASNASFGAVVHYTVIATDGTDFQSAAGVLRIAFVNKAGTLTIAEAAPADASEKKALSAGTLTTTWAVSASGNNALLRLTADTSLTATAIRCNLVIDYMGSAPLSAPTI